MKKNCLSQTIILAIVSIMMACHENVIVETTNSPNINSGSLEGKLSLGEGMNVSFDDCTIASLDGTSAINDGSFEIQADDDIRIKTFMVEKNGEVYMMSRGPLAANQCVEITVQSTAISMVMLHPLFSSLESDDYNQLIEAITESPYYQDFYDEVYKSISNKRNLYDDTNTEMMVAFSNLMEELCGGMNMGEDVVYDDSLEFISTRSSITTRAVFQHSTIDPTYIDAQINGRTLSLRTVWSTPSYYGTVEQPDGSIINKVISARSDFGVLDLAFNRTTYGRTMDFVFSEEGEYYFNFSRTNAEATFDFYMRLVASILSTLGLNVSPNDEACIQIAKEVSNFITSTGAATINTITSENFPLMDWLGIVFDATLNQINIEGNLFRISFRESVRNVAGILSGTLNWYNKIKGAANIALRLSFAVDAPNNISFCLCYYKNEVSTCTEAELLLVDGDSQVGYASQKLLEPLIVYVRTLGDDGLYHESSSFHRIKFEVVSGGGKVDNELVSADDNNKASAYWTLGENGEQIVRVTVVDIITGEEISNPVYFTASIEKAAITIRLDWKQHTGKTDLDLHVIDPNNEEIYFNHMNSESGGYLDRDDVVGPGPEHIRWIEAPVGEYQIYVHYYPNEDEDRSVTSFTVTVNVAGKSYQPVTKSIAYDQKVPVGKFTIGNQETMRAPIIDATSTVVDSNITIPSKLLNETNKP